MLKEIDEIAPLMGMDTVRIRSALELLDHEVEAKRIPGAVVSIGRNGHFIEHAVGAAVVGKSVSIPAKLDTLYDCASLTKVIITLPLILILLEEGRLRLDDPLSLFVPEFEKNGKASVTIRQLLTHTSGLIPSTDMHSHCWTPEQILEFVIGQNLVHEPGSQVLYSDMGFILLGHLASFLFGESLENVAHRRVLAPLCMSDSQFCPSPAMQHRTAATEWYLNEEGPRWGTVHDENALAMGGISGHAGLFSTVRDLSRYAEMWLNNGRTDNGQRLLSAASIAASTSSHTEMISGGNRGLGWALKGDLFDASGDLLSKASFGHTGFTGTSFYVDPIYRLTVVLLTNRVHFGRDTSVVRLRATFHNAVASALTDS